MSPNGSSITVAKGRKAARFRSGLAAGGDEHDLLALASA
jgi:hypothetical protein